MSAETLMVWTRRFIEDLRIRNYSERTIEDYTFNLRHWERFLEETRTPLDTVRPLTVGMFQWWVYERPRMHGGARSAANQNRILIQVRAFLLFLKREGFYMRDPTEGLELARQPDTLPRNILTPRERSRHSGDKPSFPLMAGTPPSPLQPREDRPGTRPSRGAWQARDRPCVAAHVRDPSPEKQREPPVCPGVAWTPLACHHGTLSAHHHHRLEGSPPQMSSTGKQQG